MTRLRRHGEVECTRESLGDAARTKGLRRFIFGSCRAGLGMIPDPEGGMTRTSVGIAQLPIHSGC